MPSKLNPYIGFKGQAKAAVEFYKTVLGGELTMSTFGEAGAAHSPEDNDKIMHAMLVTPNGITLMASDIPSDMKADEGSSISISLSGDNEAELQGYWDKLADGATITQPLVAAPWGDKFGMLTDKFGINWMVNIAGKK
jgi:PhnB protein